MLPQSEIDTQNFYINKIFGGIAAFRSTQSEYYRHQTISRFVEEDLRARHGVIAVLRTGMESLFGLWHKYKISQCKTECCEAICAAPDLLVLLKNGARFWIDVKIAHEIEGNALVLNLEREEGPTLYVMWDGFSLRCVWSYDLPKHPEWFIQIQFNEHFAKIYQPFLARLQKYFPTLKNHAFSRWQPPLPPASGDLCLKTNEMFHLAKRDYSETMNEYFRGKSCNKELNSVS